mgnify:CR=1 FL=1
MIYNYLFKFVVLGDSNVGKSCLLFRLQKDKFNSLHETTIGVDFFVHNIIINDKKIKLQIWDTAGQEVYNAITSLYYKDSNGCLIVFDVCNRESFIHCRDWLRKVKSKNCTKAIITLVGNKIDQYDKRVISREEAEHFARENGINYIETSVKDNINCEKAFLRNGITDLEKCFLFIIFLNSFL